MLEAFGGLSAEVMGSPATASEDDPDVWWTPKDHFSHMLRVERHFTRIIEAFLNGAVDDPRGAVGGTRGATREAALTEVHRVNEAFMQEHRETSFAELVRLSEEAYAETLRVMSRVADDQFDVMMPGVPWSGGTISGVLMHNGGDHFERHWKCLTDGIAAAG